jgi:hypothetical protein
MKSPSHFISAGCSYSQPYNSNASWPMHVEELLTSVEYSAHTGHGASGNQTISRKVISTVVEALEQDIPADQILVGIMWSACDRQAHYSEDHKRNYMRSTVTGGVQNYDIFLDQIETGLYDKELFNPIPHSKNMLNPFSIRNSKKPAHYILNSHWQDELTTKYFEDFVNPEKAIIETCEHILRTQWFLKDKGIRYFMTEYDHDVFTYMGPSYEGVYSDNTECLFRPEEYSKERHFAYIENPEINYLYNEIDKNYWLPVKNLQDWVTNISVHQHTHMNAEGTPADPHPSTEQHRDFTQQIILPFLLEKYNIK